ncbi:cystathionine gamma-synthase [Deferribacterales bacterium]|nr:cystathionine gamma-synthase [Deferribacterales bacterium]
MDIETILSHAGSQWDRLTGAISTPIYQATAYKHPYLGYEGDFSYSRTLSPTRQALEQTLARIEGVDYAYTFSSGMAAVDTIFRLLKPKDKIIISEDLYGGTFRLLNQTYKSYDFDVLYIDTSDNDAVDKAFKGGATAVFVEMPTNPLLKVADIRYISALAKKAGALLIVDNTFLTPLNIRVFDYGADIAVYSATKYLSGHNDVLAGAVAVKDSVLAERIQFTQNAVGAVLAPFDAWLLLRSLKTLSVRLSKQSENAIKIAQFLAEHPAVEQVNYPGLADSPFYERLKSQSAGFGAMLSFWLKSSERVADILRSVKVWTFAESLGGVESLITYPLTQTHSSIDANILERLGINDRLLRLSVGVENVDDLITDLKNVL